MSKRMTPPLNQNSTSPQTRQIDVGRKGEVGSVFPGKQPLVSVREMESRAQKTPRPQLPVTLETVGQLTPADKDGIPVVVTPDVAVPTVSNRSVPDPQK